MGHSSLSLVSILSFQFAQKHQRERLGMSQVLIRGKPFEKLWGRGAGPKAKKIPASKNQREKIRAAFCDIKKG